MREWSGHLLMNKSFVMGNRNSTMHILTRSDHSDYAAMRPGRYSRPAVFPISAGGTASTYTLLPVSSSTNTRSLLLAHIYTPS